MKQSIPLARPLMRIVRRFALVETTPFGQILAQVIVRHPYQGESAIMNTKIGHRIEIFYQYDGITLHIRSQVEQRQ